MLTGKPKPVEVPQDDMEADVRKQQIVEALQEHKHVGRAAESLGLGVRRMYRWMKRYGLTLKGVLSWPSVPRSDSNDAPAPAAPSEAKPQPAATPTRTERDSRRLSANDFSGVCLGESVRRDNRPGSADGLLDRYHRLRDK